MGLTWLGGMGTVPSGGSCRGSHQAALCCLQSLLRPCFQFPPGSCMPLCRKMGVVGWGRAGGFSEEIVRNLALADDVRVCSI